MTLPDVFLTSAHAISQSVPKAQPSGPFISIENFESTLTDSEIPNFTEPATLTAMRKLGLVPKDLCKVTDKSVSDFPDLPEVRAHVKETIEKRRQMRISQIKEIREAILSERQVETVSEEPVFDDSKITAEMKEREERENRRIERMQQKEIESLIISELTRQKILRQELERQAQFQRALAEREAETKKRLAEDAARRKEKEQRVIARIEAKDKEALAKQRENERQAEERLKQEEEERRKLAREKAAAEQERLRKAAQRREDVEEQLKKEQRAARQKEMELAKRDADRAKKNLEDTQKARAERQERLIQTKQRLADAAEREQEMLERKRKELLKKEAEARQRLASFQARKKAAILEQQEKIKAETLKHLEYSKKLEEDEQKKNLAILTRQAAHEERLQKVFSEREQRIHQAKMAEKERIATVAERRAKSEASLSDLCQKMEVEDAEVEERVKQIRHENKIERLKKIAERQLLLRTMDENAKALERKREFENAEILRKKMEREKKALLLMELQRVLGKKRKEAALQSQFRRTEVLSEFKEFLKEGGEPNLEALATRFNLDLEEIKKKVEEGNRRPLSAHTESTSEASTG
jgi:hypothetical protein